MKIAILGTGIVGQTLSVRLIALNHEVQMGTRDVEKTMSRTTGDSYGNPPFHEWHESNKQVKLVTFAEAASFGDIMINATNGGNTIAVLKMAGTAGLHGKTLLDLSNPLDFSKGMPPTLIASYCNNNSLGEEIQRSFPKVNVVKALNTMWCGIMVNPNMIQSGDHHAFICGNDVGAKMKVTDLLRQFGWKESSIIDLGDISASRGTEMILPLWLKIMNTVGSGAFNFKVVRN
jgi:predicted dinucleotide-binding enzyme